MFRLLGTFLYYKHCCMHYACLCIYPCARNLEASLVETKLLCHIACALEILIDTTKLSPSPNHVPIYTPTSNLCLCLFPHILPGNLPPSGDLQGAICQTAEEANENLCTINTPDTLLNPRAHCAGLAVERVVPLSLSSVGSPAEEWLMRGTGAISFILI